MSAQIMDGISLSKQIRLQLMEDVSKWNSTTGKYPQIDFLVASEDPASVAYVNMKQKAAFQVGIKSVVHSITKSTSQQEIISLILKLNKDSHVHGILVQHPLPEHLDERDILLKLGPLKDVDGMSPQSLGLLASNMEGFRCATPLGIMTLMDHYKISIESKHALVIGRSIIVGKPMAFLLLQKNATVTIAHSKTKNLEELCSKADIIVAGIGKSEFILGDWIKTGAIVIDAGYNKVQGRTIPIGDVHFSSAKEKASWITPVPGGVGPMTVVSLLKNTFDAAKKQYG